MNGGIYIKTEVEKQLIDQLDNYKGITSKMRAEIVKELRDDASRERLISILINSKKRKEFLSYEQLSQEVEIINVMREIIERSK